jgi:hypothetical protein
MMAPVSLNLDTSPEVERRLIEGWRRMSPSEKLNITCRMSTTVLELALAGVRQRHPAASPREQFLRLAVIVLGDDLAQRVYPDIEALDRS